ncbi:MAG: hypothetical protein BJ554DRAFT_3606, partial [Olpidium bornovanus]
MDAAGTPFPAPAGDPGLHTSAAFSRRFPAETAGFGRTRGADMIYRSARLSDFYVECAIICLLLVYTFNCVRGKAKNEKLARSCDPLVCARRVASQSLLITQNFAHVGDDYGNLIVREGATRCIVYASGRMYCQHMFVKMKLLPRHDLFGMFYRLFFPIRDTLVSGPLHVRCCLPFVIRAQYAAEELPDSHVCLSEGPELLGSILNGRLVAAIRTSGDQFEELIITDQPTEKPTTKYVLMLPQNAYGDLLPFSGINQRAGSKAAYLDVPPVAKRRRQLRPSSSSDRPRRRHRRRSEATTGNSYKRLEDAGRGAKGSGKGRDERPAG